MNMARQKAERCINPSEEVIQLGQLRVHFLVVGRTGLRPPIATTIIDPTCSPRVRGVQERPTGNLIREHRAFSNSAATTDESLTLRP